VVIRGVASASAWFARAAEFARPRRWGLIVTVLSLVANVALFYTIHDTGPLSDGKYNWVFARSLVFDHDIDFANDYRLCGDHGRHNRDRGGGHPDNPFYVGPSLFWVPAIEVARVVYRFAPRSSEAAKQGCVGPIAKFGLSMGYVACALLIWLSYCAARRLGDDYPAALAAGLFAFGTTLSAYATRNASYSHVYDGASVAALLVLSLRAYERPDRLARWALAGVAVGACILYRFTNGPLGLLPAALALITLYRRPRRLAGALGVLTVGALAFGVAPQLLIYKYFYGRYLFLPQGPYFMQPAHAHPWLLLFAPKGLFFLAPVAWFSVAGAVYAFRRGAAQNLLLVVLGVFAVEHFIAACALDWDASSTLGARRLISFFPLLIFLATPALGRMVSWFSGHPERARGLLLAALVLPLGMLFLGTALASDVGDNYDFYPSQASTYGGAVSASLGAIDRVLGGVAMLPGQIVFSLRYRAPHSTYWDAAYTNFLLRNPLTMTLRNTVLDLGDPHLHAAMPGFHRVRKAARVHGRATLVFCAEWSRATDIAITASAAIPTTVRVSRRSFFGATTPYGSVALTPEEDTFTLGIPPGGFDSGIEELVFETTGGTAEIRKVEVLDQTVYPAVP
jgi:hypothetical protein